MKSRGLQNAAWAAVALFGGAAASHGDPITVEKIETANAVLSLKAGSGDLIGVQWKRPEVAVIREGKLGENFRIRLPKPDYDANYFNSRDQVVRKLERLPDRIVLHYGPLQNEREEVNVKVAYEIRDIGGQLQFSIQVDNPTERPLAEVFYGIVGGQQGIGERLETKSLIPGVEAATWPRNLAPTLFGEYNFSDCCWGTRYGYAGYKYPGQMSMGWMDVYNPKAGVGYYYANQDLTTRVSAFYTEMHPYVRRTSFPRGDNWPSAADLPEGEPIGITMGWVNFPYTAKGRFNAGPIALQVHEGDWHAGAKLYRKWYDQHFNFSRPSWLRHEMAWYVVNLLDPDDKIYFRFKDLPKLAADAKRYGVTTVHIFGWPTGGQDGARPDYSPDPRLGTPEEFRKALLDMRAMGVHPLLYANVFTAETSTAAFHTRWSRYAVQQRGAPGPIAWQFSPSTIDGRTLKASGRYLTRINPAHAEYRNELLRQYIERIEDGADGFQMDGGCPPALDFNALLSASPDQAMMQGCKAAFDEFLSRAQRIRPDVSLSLQESFDRDFPYNDGSFLDLHSAKDGEMPVRYTFPEWKNVIGAFTPGEFDPLNNGLRYGLIWIMAPHSFTASMDDELTRPLSRYLSELIRIRKQYADLLFYGRYNETMGAQVQGDKDNVRYSVFTPMDTNSPQRACVVVNFGDKEENAEVSLEGKAGQKVTVSVPFEPDHTAILPVKLTLPAHRAAVVVTRE